MDACACVRVDMGVHMDLYVRMSVGVNMFIYLFKIADARGMSAHHLGHIRTDLCGHAPSGHQVQIVELFENATCGCYFYLRYHNTI